MKPSFVPSVLSLESGKTTDTPEHRSVLCRRRFMLLLAALGAACATSCGEDSMAAALPTDALAAFSDALIPSDEFGPSASETGVHLALANRALNEPEFRQFLVLGFRWIESQTRQKFSDLSIPARNQLLLQMSEMPPDSMPRTLFDHLRDQCFAEYYASPLAWRGLAIDRPPQPVGYPDFPR